MRATVSAGRGRKWTLAAIVVIATILAAPARDDALALTTDELLEEIQHRAFDFFWNESNASKGLIKDRNTPGSPCSIASVGYGLSAICIAIDHGWITREIGRDRVLTTLQTFWNGPQGSAQFGMMGYQGFFYHFLDMGAGLRTWDSELSTIDTGLFLAGVIDVRQYFDTADPVDNQIRTLGTDIYERVNWEFARNFGPGIRLGWKPITGFSGFGTWVGYNEAMIMYILALGSPTHPVPESNWFTWVSGYDWQTRYGQTFVNFPPLFGHQYSHCWVDFRNIQDPYMLSKGITYFENSRRATLAARAYCIDNPGGFVGYDQFNWGLTASDGPFGYNARGAPPAQNDDGTITPTAAASSIAFAPEAVIPTLQYWYDNYFDDLWSTYGFKDAYNLTHNWWATDYIGIDQGPIVLMIENFRTGAVWNRFMSDPDVQMGLARAGFATATAVDPTTVGTQGPTLLQNAPNPFRGSSLVTYRLEDPGYVSLQLYDVSGRRVRTLVDGVQSAGIHRITLDGRGLASGVYAYRLEVNGRRALKRAVVLD